MGHVICLHEAMGSNEPGDVFCRWVKVGERMVAIGLNLSENRCGGGGSAVFEYDEEMGWSGRVDVEEAQWDAERMLARSPLLPFLDGYMMDDDGPLSEERIHEALSDLYVVWVQDGMAGLGATLEKAGRRSHE